MKKNIKKILKKLLTSVGQGLLIFTIFGLALYAYASVTFPSLQPSVVTGVVGQFVGVTDVADPYNGSQGGYLNSSSHCSDIYPGSHICIAEEITRSYVSSNIAITSAPQEFAWINSGAPGYTANVNDCLGWQSDNNGMYGAVWNIAGRSFAINPCNSERIFACCK